MDLPRRLEFVLCTSIKHFSFFFLSEIFFGLGGGGGIICWTNLHIQILMLNSLTCETSSFLSID